MINTNKKKNVILFVFCCMLFNLAQGFSFNPFNKTKEPVLLIPKLTMFQKIKTGITFKRLFLGSAAFSFAFIIYIILRSNKDFGPGSDFQKTLNSTFEEFKELTKKDLNINKVDMLGLTPICYLLLEMLHNKRPDINVQNKKEKIKFLLKNGADLNKAKPIILQRSLLHLFFINPDIDTDPEIIALLIDNNINLNAKDCFGATPLDYLMLSFSKKETPNKQTIISLLINNGATGKVNNSTPVINRNNRRPNFYKVLELKNNATKREITKAKRKFSLKYHPDRHPNLKTEEKVKLETKLAKVNEACDCLFDTEKRKQHDSEIKNNLWL